jgi:hypothetical protein
MAEKPNPLGRWRPVSQRHEINTPWLGVRNVTYELPNGQTVENYYLVDKPPVVVVVLVRANKTFLIKEFERGVDKVDISCQVEELMKVKMQQRQPDVN